MREDFKRAFVSKQPPNVAVRVSAQALPLACPLPATDLRFAHPKVYLPIEAQGTAECPYCGTVYVLEEGKT